MSSFNDRFKTFHRFHKSIRRLKVVTRRRIHHQRVAQCSESVGHKTRDKLFNFTLLRVWLAARFEIVVRALQHVNVRLNSEPLALTGILRLSDSHLSSHATRIDCRLTATTKHQRLESTTTILRRLEGFDVLPRRSTTHKRCKEIPHTLVVLLEVTTGMEEQCNITIIRFSILLRKHLLRRRIMFTDDIRQRNVHATTHSSTVTLKAFRKHTPLRSKRRELLRQSRSVRFVNNQTRFLIQTSKQTIQLRSREISMHHRLAQANPFQRPEAHRLQLLNRRQRDSRNRRRSARENLVHRLHELNDPFIRQTNEDQHGIISLIDRNGLGRGIIRNAAAIERRTKGNNIRHDS